MINQALRPYLLEIAKRGLVEGGVSDRIGGHYRPDATAWAILVLSIEPSFGELVSSARLRLEKSQSQDGRVVISKDHPDAYWPTPMAILAWHGSPKYERPLAKAVDFLTQTTGVHWEKSENDVVGHDTLIPGWPWIDSTHSWVTPTAQAMIALTVAGFGEHDRVMEGKRLLVDRQLPRGGWNYGNTSVLGQELRPFPETTGVALNALAGRVSREDIQPSLDYILEEVPRLRTPLSLAWAILGLKAWDLGPERALEWIVETLERGSRYGGYDTSALCVLLAAAVSPRGLESLMTQSSSH